MRPIDEIIDKMGLDTIRNLDTAVQQGYKTGKSIIADIPCFQTASAKSFHQVICNLAIDSSIEKFFSINPQPGLEIVYAPNFNNSCRHIEVRRDHAIITISSTYSFRKNQMPRQALFRQELANCGQIGFEDLGSNLLPSEDFIHAPYRYAILCHRAKYVVDNEITAFTFLGVPERMCYNWLESETIASILDTRGVIDPAPNLQSIDPEYEISLKKDVLLKIQQSGG